MESYRFELKVKSELESLVVIGDFIAETLNKFGGDQATIFQVQLSADEACTNIIKHAYIGEEGIIDISCELQDNDFIITIKDTGRPFDPSAIPTPDLETDLDGRMIGGLGIYIMRKLMDEVSYNFDAEKGNTLVMRKTLTGKK